MSNSGRYEPHGFLDTVGVDFEGLDVPTGSQIFARLADWLESKNGAHIIPPWSVESVALLYHIALGCAEKVKSVTDGKEVAVWKKLRRDYTDMAFRFWSRIWRAVADNVPDFCGTSADDAICGLLRGYDRNVLVTAKPKRRRKPIFGLELGDIPDWEDD